MKAGRELDALVAEKVMGMLKYIQGDITIFENEEYLWRDWEVPYFSDDIAAAWQVVEKMREKYVINIEIDCENTWVELWRDSTDEPYKQVADEYGDTAPLAICLAALRAVGAIAAEDEDYGGHA